MRTEQTSYLRVQAALPDGDAGTRERAIVCGV